jgi:multidrug efflux pump subunit AcrB
VRVRQSGTGGRVAEEVSELELVPVSGDSTRRLPVTAVGRWRLVPADATIEHYNGRRMADIQVFVRAGQLPSTVLDAFRARIKQRPLHLPPGYSLEVAGESGERDRAVANLTANMGVLLAVAVSALVLSLHSFRLAAVIVGVAVASIGLGLLSLIVFGYPFGFMAIVGIMGLVGVAINDSIVVIAAIEADPAASQGDRAAMADVTFRCTRHVWATTLSTIAGFLPLVLARGSFWPPLAVAIAGGVAGATLLALYAVPASYALLHGARTQLGYSRSPGEIVR